MHRQYRFGILLMVIALLASCGDVPLVGLFESIERERKIIDDRGLDNNISVAAMAKAAGKYFIAAGSLWCRSVTDTSYPDKPATWFTIDPPGSELDNYVTQSVVVADLGGGTLVYAVFTDQTGSKSGIYSFDPAFTILPNYGYDDTVEKPSVALTGPIFGAPAVEVRGLGELFVVNDGTNDHLLVVVKSDEEYPRYLVQQTVDGTSFNPMTTTEAHFPVIDLATDGTDVAYLTRFTVSTGTVTADVSINDDVTTDNIKPIIDPKRTRIPRFGGLFHDGSALWLSDNEGYLYRSLDFVGSWQATADPHLVSSAPADPLPFTDFAIANSVVVVGTEGYGYRELKLGTQLKPYAVTPDPAGSNYQASELARSAVLTFFVDYGLVGVPVPQQDGSFTAEDGDLLFAGTSNAGLWKALYYAQAPQWLRE